MFFLPVEQFSFLPAGVFSFGHSFHVGGVALAAPVAREMWDEQGLRVLVTIHRGHGRLDTLGKHLHGHWDLGDQVLQGRVETHA